MISRISSDQLKIRFPKEFLFGPSFSSEAKIDLDVLIEDLNSQYQFLKDLVIPFVKTPPKSTVDAIKLRNLGNQKFKEGSYHEALKLYTESVSFSANDSEELALAYANRSAALLRIREYVQCLLDVNRALCGKYPQNLRKKLRERKKECLAELRRTKGIKVAGNEIDPIKMDSDEDIEWRKLRKFKNPLLPNSSSKIKLKCDEKWGRHMVATDDIDPGELLSSQKFFVMMLEPGEQVKYKNCSHCLSKCYALIPCTSCSQMLYCSNSCRERAYSLYHRIECKILELEKMESTSMMKQEFSALRMLLTGTEQGAQLKNLMKKLTLPDIFAENTNPENKPFFNDYVATLKMCRTFRFSSVKLFILSVVTLILRLRRVGFFGNEEPQDSLSKTELFATMLLLNHLVSAQQLNKFSIDEIHGTDFKNANCESSIGAGICTLNNMINHSCHPNVLFLSRKGEHVIFAIRPIKKDEQIFTTYCPLFAVEPKADRIAKLSSFGFTCNCEACTQNWPLNLELVSYKTKFIIHDKKKAVEEIMALMSPIIENGFTGLNNGQILAILCKLCKWLYANIKPPSIEFTQCQSSIRKFLQLWSDDSNREYMTVVRNERFFETILTCIVNKIYQSWSGTPFYNCGFTP